MTRLPELLPSQIKGDGTMKAAKVMATAMSENGQLFAVLRSDEKSERGFTTHSVNVKSGAIGNGLYGLSYAEALENLVDRARPIT